MSRSLLRETVLLEREVDTLVMQSALMELLNSEFVVRSVLAEERKVVRYAIQQGIIDKRDVNLNEGLLADIVLGAGQMLGNIGSSVGLPLGSAFGAAGVLWYGNEAIKGTPGTLQFYMDIIFCLFSAAAVGDPTPATGTAATIARTILAPFVKAGAAARALGQGVLNAGKALAWTKSAGPATVVAVEAAVKAEPAIVRATPFIERVVTGAKGVMESVASAVKSLPGGKTFARIVETVAKYATQAWQFAKSCIEALIAVGKSATKAAAGKAGTTAVKAAGTRGAAAGAEAAAVAGARLGVRVGKLAQPAVAATVRGMGRAAQAVLVRVSRMSPAMMERIFVGQVVNVAIKGTPVAASLVVSRSGALALQAGPRVIALAPSQVVGVLGQIARAGGPRAAEAATAALMRTGEKLAPNYYQMALTAINGALGGGEPDPALAAELGV